MIDLIMQYGEVFSIVIFLLPPALSLLTLYFTKRKLIWLSIPITIIVDLLVWGKALLSPEFRGLALLFLIPQVLVTALVSFGVTSRIKRTN